MERSSGRQPLVAALSLIAGLIATGGQASAATTALRNPIAPVLTGAPNVPAAGLDSPDPFIFTAKGRYWLTTSATRQIVVRSATSLGGLADAPLQRLWPPPGTTPPKERCCDFWAPEIHRLRGPAGPRYYLYSAADDGDVRRHRIQVLESARDDPAGPYRYRGTLDLGENYAIDPTVFTAGDSTYVAYSGGRGFVTIPAQLSLARLRNPWTVTGVPVQISEPTLPWETENAPINEGPEILRRGGSLHVIYSASLCLFPQYKLGRLTVPAAADLMDPATWARAKAPAPVFQSDPARNVFNTGHGSFFRSPDGTQDWQVYHATEGSGLSCFGGLPRTTRAQPLRFDAQDRPVFGRPVALGTDIPAPSGDTTLERQAEDARVVAGAGRLTAIRDPGLVGGAGRRLSGGAAELSVDIPRAGRQHIALRVTTGPGQARLRVSITGGPARGVVRATTAARAGHRELDLGTADLPRGRVRMRVAAVGGGSGVGLDQLRLEPTAGG